MKIEQISDEEQGDNAGAPRSSGDLQNAMPPSADRPSQEVQSRKSSVPKPLQKIHDRLRDNVELFKLHLQHDHMSTENFKKRTSHLRIPAEIYKNYDKLVK